MTVLEFRRSEQLTQELEQVLGNPTLRLALETIRAENQPGDLPKPIPGVDQNVFLAHKYVHASGVNQALDVLEKMKELAPTRRTTQTEEPFSYVANQVTATI
jgi:hypothetical protein